MLSMRLSYQHRALTQVQKTAFLQDLTWHEAHAERLMCLPMISDTFLSWSGEVYLDLLRILHIVCQTV